MSTTLKQKYAVLLEQIKLLIRWTFAKKVNFGYVGIVFLNTTFFFFFYSYANLRVLVKHHLPRGTPPESGPSASELDDEENVVGRKPTSIGYVVLLSTPFRGNVLYFVQKFQASILEIP